MLFQGLLSAGQEVPFYRYRVRERRFGFRNREDLFRGCPDGTGVEEDLVAAVVGRGLYVDVLPEALAERRGFVAGGLRGADVFALLD